MFVVKLFVVKFKSQFFLDIELLLAFNLHGQVFVGKTQHNFSVAEMASQLTHSRNKQIQSLERVLVLGGFVSQLLSTFLILL
jgi:hypothetical protein